VAEAPQRLAWLSPRRVAVVAGNPYDGATLIMADPVAGRVVSRRQLDPAGIVTVRAGDRLVLLHTPVDRIGPVRLSVVDARGRLLPLLRRPAHWLVPPAEAKLAAGSWRSACWLGGGTLAVWGTDARVSGDTPESLRSRELPSGVKLIDTRAWTVRPLDPAATQASWQAGRLLAYGGLWGDDARRRGVGITVYGPGNEPPRHLLGGQVVDDARLHGDLVYASIDKGSEQWARAVVSLPSGRVVASSEQLLPTLLLDDRGQAC